MSDGRFRFEGDLLLIEVPLSSFLKDHSKDAPSNKRELEIFRLRASLKQSIELADSLTEGRFVSAYTYHQVLLLLAKLRQAIAGIEFDGEILSDQVRDGNMGSRGVFS